MQTYLNSFDPAEFYLSLEKRLTVKWNTFSVWMKATDVLLSILFVYLGYSEWQANNQLWAIFYIVVGMFFLRWIVIDFRTSKRKCPFCAEFVQPDATVCKHCRKDIPPLTDKV